MKRPTLGLAWVLLLSQAGLAQDPEGIFRELFGPEAKKVAATRDKDDDLQFAKAVLKTAHTLQNKPDVQLYFCAKAYEFASKGLNGCPVALEVIDFVNKRKLDRSGIWKDKRLELYRSLCRTSRGDARLHAAKHLLLELLHAGDRDAEAAEWAKAKASYAEALSIAKGIKSYLMSVCASNLKKAERRQYVESRIAIAKRQVEERPEYRPARSVLLRLYLLEMDCPSEAAKWLDNDSPQRFRTYVPLATKKVDGLPDTTCLELGDWYAGLARSAIAASKPALLQRAMGYYEEVLFRGKTGTAVSRKALVALDKVTKERLKYGPHHLVPASVWPIICSGVHSGKYLKTKMSGGPGGGPFQEVPEPGALLIGLRLTTTRPPESMQVMSVQPIFVTPSGKKMGVVHGRSSNGPIEVVAKPGYGIGAVAVRGTALGEGFRVIFMKIGKGRLDPKTAYHSKWYCGTGEGRETSFDGKGGFVVGIYGRKGGWLDAVGLVHLP